MEQAGWPALIRTSRCTRVGWNIDRIDADGVTVCRECVRLDPPKHPVVWETVNQQDGRTVSADCKGNIYPASTGDDGVGARNHGASPIQRDFLNLVTSQPVFINTAVACRYGQHQPTSTGSSENPTVDHSKKSATLATIPSTHATNGAMPIERTAVVVPISGGMRRSDSVPRKIAPALPPWIGRQGTMVASPLTSARADESREADRP
jgi:hypothetical protein